MSDNDVDLVTYSERALLSQMSVEMIVSCFHRTHILTSCDRSAVIFADRDLSIDAIAEC